MNKPSRIVKPFTIPGAGVASSPSLSISLTMEDAGVPMVRVSIGEIGGLLDPAGAMAVIQTLIQAASRAAYDGLLIEWLRSAGNDEAEARARFADFAAFRAEIDARINDGEIL